ncbi:POU domain, class 6, transcription factor 1 [Halotydeus destructor]|nr:POU domain, class 6, transcription factor 1 [Halotydeus destructor]
MNQVAFMQLPNGQVVMQQMQPQFVNQHHQAVMPTMPTMSPIGQQVQYVQNESGQIFAINTPVPQPMVNYGVHNQQSVIIAPQQPQVNQFVQVIGPDGSVQLMPISGMQPQPQLVQVAPTPTLVQPTAELVHSVQQLPKAVQQQSMQLGDSQSITPADATRLHVQQIIQEQQNQILQQQLHQHQPSRQTTVKTKSSRTTTIKQTVLVTSTAQQTQTLCSDSDESNLVINTDDCPPSPSASPLSQTVSSTTPLKSSSSSNRTQSPSQHQTCFPTSITNSMAISPNSVNQEPESTTSNPVTISKLSVNDNINSTDLKISRDGVNLEEIREFAKQFKMRRLSLGLTQTQVGQALSATEGPSYSQSAICRFEKLDITPKSAQKIKPVLEYWMTEAETRFKNGNCTLTEMMSSDSSKKRKRRTSFTPQTLDVLNVFFEKNTHPTGGEMTELANHLNIDREVVRVWFCNKRQALRSAYKRIETNPV